MIIAEESSDLCNYHKFSPRPTISLHMLKTHASPHSWDFNSKLRDREAFTPIERSFAIILAVLYITVMRVFLIK